MRRFYSRSFAFWLFAGSAFGAQTACDRTPAAVSARSSYALGVASYHAKHFAEADAEFGAAIAQAPRDRTLAPVLVRDAYLYRGVSRASLHRDAAAKTDLLVAVRTHPRSRLAWDSLGWARAGLGDAAGAVADYDRGLRLDPRDWNDRLNRGIALEKVGRYRLAIADLTAAIHHHAFEVTAFVFRGLAYFNRREYALARRDFTNAIRRNAKSPAWDYRCQAGEMLGTVAAALYDCNRAVALFPHWAGAYLDRAWAQTALGAPRAAFADADTAIRSAPQDAAAYRFRAWIGARMSRYRGAFADYAHALAVAPSDSDARTERRALAHWIAAAQDAGVDEFGIASLDVDRLENEGAPTPENYRKMAWICRWFFSSSGPYFDDCARTGILAAKSDQSADDDGARQAEAQDYDVAQVVQAEIAHEQGQHDQDRSADAREQAAYESALTEASESADQSQTGDQTPEDSVPVEESDPDEEPAAQSESVGN